MAKCENTVFDTFKSTLNSAVETLSSVAQSFVEKNRTKAKLNRLRMVMKTESELMNRAYIALGKEYYEVLKKGDVDPTDKQEKLLEVIDSCKAKIGRARDCYRKIIENQSEFMYSAPDDKEQVKSEDVVDITVACSNESDYNSNPFAQAEEKAADVKEEVCETVEDVKDEVSETVEDVKDEVSDTVEDVKESVSDTVEDVKDTVSDTAEDVQENFSDKVEDIKETISKKAEEAKAAADEECPEDELF